MTNPTATRPTRRETPRHLPRWAAMVLLALYEAAAGPNWKRHDNWATNGTNPTDGLETPCSVGGSASRRTPSDG